MKRMKSKKVKCKNNEILYFISFYHLFHIQTYKLGIFCRLIYHIDQNVLIFMGKVNKLILKKDKMNKKQQQAYIGFLDQILEAQKVSEALKVQISGCKSYNPRLIWKKISSDQRNVTIKDMRNYMAQRIAFNERQLYEVFQKFDSNRNGFISQQDFVKEMIPLNKKSPSAEGVLTAEIEGLFIGLLIEIVSRLRIIEVARKQIALIPPYNSFVHLDSYKKGIIGLGQLCSFFSQNDIELNPQQLLLMLHGLRRRAYLQVNLQVWCQNLNPLQFGQYLGYKTMMQEDQEQAFLKRSRNEQDLVRRSRIQSQRLQSELMRSGRRKQAELERQLQLQGRINSQIVKHQENNSRMVRKVFLEEEIEGRRNLQAINRNLYENYIVPGHLQNQADAELLFQRERQISQNLAKSVINRQQRVQQSRRLRDYQRDIALKNQIQRDKQLYKASRIRDLQISRRVLEEQNELDRKVTQRQLQLERIRQMQVNKQYQYRPLDIEKELQKTRAEMRQRRSRIQRQSRFNHNSEYPPTISRNYYA